MKGLIRGVAGAALVLGATACADDYSIDFGGAPTAVQPSPEVMFVNSGAQKELLVRLVNDRNQSTPASFQVANVGAGLTVTYDATYRPQWTSTDPTLEPKVDKEQQRYTVAANIPTGGKRTFQLTSGGLTATTTVYVLPTTMGAAIANPAPALGDVVTINAPEGQSFSTTASATGASTVSFPEGGAPIIQEITAKSITFIPRPGTTGAATVTGVTLDYAPTLAPRSLTTSNEITVPAVTNIPLVYSSASPAAGATVTVTAAGFRFLPNVSFTIGGAAAFVLSVSADSTTATILPPPSVAGGTAVVSNAVLSFLPAVGLLNVPSTATMTTQNYPAPVNAGTSTATANVFSAASPGVGRVYAESGVLGFGPNVNYSFNGAPRFYQLNVTVAGSYTIRTSWNGGGDMDVYLRNGTNTANIGTALTGNMPEVITANLAVGTYFIVLHDYENFGPLPTQVLITVK